MAMYRPIQRIKLSSKNIKKESLEYAPKIFALIDKSLFVSHIYENEIFVDNSKFIAKLVSDSFEKLNLYPNPQSSKPDWGVYCTLIEKRIDQIEQHDNDFIRGLKYFPIEKYTIARYINDRFEIGWQPCGSFLVTSLGNYDKSLDNSRFRLSVAPNGIQGVYPSLLSVADAMRDYIIEQGS